MLTLHGSSHVIKQILNDELKLGSLFSDLYIFLVFTPLKILFILINNFPQILGIPSTRNVFTGMQNENKVH